MNYYDVVSGDESMILQFTLGGVCDGIMGVSLMVFKKYNRSYPTKGVEDFVTGVG